MNGSSNSTFTGNSIAGNYIPSANAELNTTAFLVNYNLNDSFSVIGGIKNNALNSFNLTSIYGSYDVSSKSNSAYVVGSAFENPDIALRAEILLQPSSKIKTTGTYTSAAVDFPTAIENMGYTDIPAGVTGSFAATLNTPEMITLNFQSGIAADTLITGSIHQAKWKSSQVNVDVSTVVPAINTAAAVSSDFSDSTKYSIGLARKFSSSLSGSVSYNQEVGSGSTSTSTFTMSNGSKSLNLGFRYSFEQANLSVGVSQTMFNDVTVDANSLTSPIEYKNNTATTMGIKLSTNF
jgi:long-subunit fatty acid transport protein